MKWTRMAPLWLYHVYMLRCSDGFLGHTNDLEHRLAAHERGAIEGYTLASTPEWSLVFSDQFSTRQEAGVHRERQIKGCVLGHRIGGRRIKRRIGMGWWNYPTEVVAIRAPFRQAQDAMGRGLQSFDRLRMKVLVA